MKIEKNAKVILRKYLVDELLSESTSRSLSSSLSTASTIGTIMAVVAVLEIHIDRNIVGIIKPSINLEICNIKYFEPVKWKAQMNML